MNKVSAPPTAFVVIPAQAGIQGIRAGEHWVPAFAGTTLCVTCTGTSCVRR